MGINLIMGENFRRRQGSSQNDLSPWLTFNLGRWMSTRILFKKACGSFGGHTKWVLWIDFLKQSRCREIIDCELLQLRGSENLGKGISEEYKAARGQKDVQRKVDTCLHSADAEVAHSMRGSWVSAERIQSLVAGSQGASLGGRKVDFSANRGSRAEKHRNT